MAATAGFRHRLKRRHGDPDSDYMPENKRHLSERMAQEIGVLKLDDHSSSSSSPSLSSSFSSPSPASPSMAPINSPPQSPYSSSPPYFTPPPSPFHTTSYQPSSPYSFSQRFTPQNFQQQLQQMNQISNPVHQYQLQQQLQTYQILQQRQLLNPSSPPLSPITYEHPKTEPTKALTVYQPFQFSKPKKKLDLDEEEEEDIEKDEEKLPTYTVNIPEPQSPEPLIRLHQEDTSRALILYSAPSEVIQKSISKPTKIESMKESMDMDEDAPILHSGEPIMLGSMEQPIPNNNTNNNNNPFFSSPFSSSSPFPSSTAFSSSSPFYPPTFQPQQSILSPSDDDNMED